MFNNGVLLKGNTVAPFAGAWIEMITNTMFRFRMLSLPSRERGLKWQWQQRADAQKDVAPFAGAWIEIGYLDSWSKICWMSLPSRERGLKCVQQTRRILFLCVAPFAGAWIEI